MKRFLATVIIASVIACSYTAFADDTEYHESPAYAELADKVSGNDTIGAFVDYKSLADRHLNDLLSMNSAERQQLITQILTDAGKIYVSEEEVDFTDGELAEYSAYAAANVAEVKNYLKHKGMSSIADVPLTVDFGSRDYAKLSFFKSYLATAYNSGVSDILIKNKGIGVQLDITELASITDGRKITVSLVRHKKADLAEDYKKAAKSDEVYQIIISDGDEIGDVLSSGKIMLYGCADNDRVYAFSANGTGKLISTDYDGEILSFPINDIRWFGIYSGDEAYPQHFTDVPSDHWAYEYIEYLADAGIIAGEGGAFNPDGSVTREEFVKMLMEALDIKADDAQCSFDDVPEDEWYYEYVASAYTSGIVNGVTESRFGVGENVSRQDIAVMAYRALEYADKSMRVPNDLYVFYNDEADISDYAWQSVEAMNNYGVISGDEYNNFRPLAPATRAETAKIIYMIIDYIERI